MPRPAPRTDPHPASGAGGRPARLAITVSVEALMAIASVFWALLANRPFFDAALSDRLLAEPGSWGFALALLLMLVAVNYLLLALVCTRHTVKPVLAVLVVVTAFATYFMQTYGTYLDPSMMRSVLRTDVTEVRELLSWALAPHLLLYAALPLLLLWRVRLRPRRWQRTLGLRLATVAGALALLLGALMPVFQPLASMMRNHKEMRYLVTPANYLWSLGIVVAARAEGAARPRQPIGLDAHPGPAYVARTRPLVVVLVVGETARAANWGLNGYARQTTPELAALAARPAAAGAPVLLNFPQVTSCGTNTEVSLPCMFAPVGRRDYDQARVRYSESLLHVAARAGVAVLWRDNQSGCKGVCKGLPHDDVASLKLPGLCSAGRCLDEGLLSGLDERLAAAATQGGKPPGTQLLVLHMLGNHGPGYFRRYPPAFARFVPACNFDDLQKCTRAEIVNAYDNALLYTDHVLASLITRLQAAADTVDAVVLYVSDHGESLGENNLFLHGLPYAIAPDMQTRVPMVMWFSAGALRSQGLDEACLQRRSLQPAAHDHLFHTVLGLLGVQTALYEAPFDLAQGCRKPLPAP
jgi:lipid A ethanolaminephosphotransferase